MVQPSSQTLFVYECGTEGAVQDSVGAVQDHTVCVNAVQWVRYRTVWMHGTDGNVLSGATLRLWCVSRELLMLSSLCVLVWV
jgi:hypothetical protein